MKFNVDLKKTELRNRESALEKQYKKQAALDKIILRDSGNRAKINQSQVELLDAVAAIKNTTTQLVEGVEKFEMQKRVDLKTCLSDLVWNEIGFHAK